MKHAVLLCLVVLIALFACCTCSGSGSGAEMQRCSVEHNGIIGSATAIHSQSRNRVIQLRGGRRKSYWQRLTKKLLDLVRRLWRWPTKPKAAAHKQSKKKAQQPDSKQREPSSNMRLQKVILLSQCPLLLSNHHASAGIEGIPRSPASQLQAGCREQHLLVDGNNDRRKGHCVC